MADRHGSSTGAGAGEVRERCGKGAGKVRGVSTCKTQIPRCIPRPKNGENGRCGKGAGKVQERCGTGSPHRLSTGVPAFEIVLVLILVLQIVLLPNRI